MQIIAHDPARFEGLYGYPFAENWLTIDLGESTITPASLRVLEEEMARRQRRPN